MDIDKDNLIVYKSRNFAIRIVRLYKYLVESKKENVLSKQLLRSGTSIGANINEAVRGQSKADFGTKMNIALKEANESLYWLDILHATEYISDVEYESVNADCTELFRILISIVKTTFDSRIK